MAEMVVSSVCGSTNTVGKIQTLEGYSITLGPVILTLGGEKAGLAKYQLYAKEMILLDLHFLDSGVSHGECH
jgi:hypothetical protein